MATDMDELTKLIQDQPDDSSYDEILRELAFNLMVQRGLMDSDEGRTISNEEMQRRIRSGQKEGGQRRLKNQEVFYHGSTRKYTEDRITTRNLWPRNPRKNKTYY